MNKNPTLAHFFYFSDGLCLFFSRKMRELAYYVKTGLKLITVQTKLLTVSRKEQSVLAISEISAKQNLEN